MPKKLHGYLRIFFNIVLITSIIVTGVCFIVSCLKIYYSGADNPYSREIVATMFARISIPVYICIILVIISIIVELISPTNKSKPKDKDIKNLLKKAYLKKNMATCDKDILKKIQQENLKRKIIIIVRTLLICLTTIVFLAYALNTGNFHSSEINSSMINAMYVLLPCITVAFTYSIFAAYSLKKSMTYELNFLKQVPISTESSHTTTNAYNPRKALTLLRIVLILAGVAITIYGLISGGTADVLTKAINICTECIGLG